VAATPNPALQFQTVTFTATVNPTPAGGTVAFDDGTSPSGCSAVALTGATATCQSTGLGVGPHQITAVYSGTPGDLGSTSTAVSETVIADTPANLAKLTCRMCRPRRNSWRCRPAPRK
jgi:Bacterial Ig-like domain (group 3)